MLKTVILHKVLKQDFICVRSSFYDGFYNKVDNLILERKTGNLICTLDMVADPDVEKCKEKIEKFMGI